MKTLINCKATRAGIKFAARIVSKKNALPILDNALIYANGNFSVTTTDLDMTVTARLPGITTVEGKTTLPVARLLSAVSGTGEVELETNDKNVTSIKTGAVSQSIYGLSETEFPQMPVQPESAARLVLPADLFIACLKQVSEAMSTDESRYVLNGVCLDISAEEIKFIATDGRRLHTAILPTGGTPLSEAEKIAVAGAQKTLDYANGKLAAAQTAFDSELAANPPTYLPVEVESFGTLYRKTDHHNVACKQSVLDDCKAAVEVARGELNKFNAGRSILLPRAAVLQLIAMPLDKKMPGVLTLSDWPSNASVDCGIFTITTKLIEGNYPNYKQVIPADSKIDVLVNIGAFRECLAIAEKTTSEKSNSTKLVFTKNLLTITSNAPEIGETKVSMPVNYQPTMDSEGVEIPFAIAFNPAYLIDTADSFESAGAEMTLHLIDELSPIRITNSAGNVAVIMPIRLS